MKITKHLSLISIVLVGVLVIKKMNYDIEYKIEVLDNTDSIAAGSMIIPVYYFALILISLIASIIGYTQKNKYRKCDRLN